MTDPADLVLRNGEVHTLTVPDETHEAVAVRDGLIVRVDSDYEIEFLHGAETRVIDLEGRVLLPGFVDAHTHMEMVGRYLVYADLSEADSPEDAVDLLAAVAEDRDDEYVLGYGYDESTWDDARYLTRTDLDAVSTSRPVVGFREDMHTASVNSVVLDRHGEDFPDRDVNRARGEPTGVVTEESVDVLFEVIAPEVEETRELLAAATDRAVTLGVTGVHDMVRRSHGPRVYRELADAGDLPIRVRLNYWADHLDAVLETGLTTNAGSERIRVGAIKTYTDGTVGGRTAKLSEPYADQPDDGEATGTWVVDPDELESLVERADDAGLQFAAHAIGDEAIDAVLDIYEAVADDAAAARHRVEHAELIDDAAIERFADLGVVASVQPNFLKWAREDGLYESRLGTERTRESNRFAALLAAGVDMAFGSDSMPLGPLYGVEQTLTAPAADQRLDMTEALRAYTAGAAYAGFDEERVGTIEVGKLADLVVLDRSPWDVPPDSVGDIEIDLTIVDGEIVYRKD